MVILNFPKTWSRFEPWFHSTALISPNFLFSLFLQEIPTLSEGSIIYHFGWPDTPNVNGNYCDTCITSSSNFLYWTGPFVGSYDADWSLLIFCFYPPSKDSEDPCDYSKLACLGSKCISIAAVLVWAPSWHWWLGPQPQQQQQMMMVAAATILLLLLLWSMWCSCFTSSSTSIITHELSSPFKRFRRSLWLLKIWWNSSNVQFKPNATGSW